MLRVRTLSTLSIGGSAFLLAACMSTGATSSRVEEVLRTDDARRMALLNGNADILDRVMAEDVALIYGDGTTETKVSLLAKIRSGKLRWTKLQYDPAQVRLHGDVAVVTGIARTSRNHEPEHVAYVTRVYFRQQGTWRLISNQTTRTQSPP